MPRMPLMLALAVIVGIALVIGPRNLDAQPMGLGDTIISAGVVLQLEVLPGDAAFTSDIRLVLPSGTFPIATSQEVGRVVRLELAPAGVELIFQIFVRETEDTFRTGPGDRNPDGLAHATVVALGPSTWIVSFEDTAGGDFDFNDVVFQVRSVTPEPDPPTASNVSISGTPQVGQVLTGRYTYTDAEGDLEGASTFRWLRETLEQDPLPIDGATDRTYTLVAADDGALIRFEVTPVAQSGTSPGLAVTSAAVGPVAVPPNDPPVASNVSISGIPQVGQVLRGSFTYADAENDPQGASTFRWLRGTTPIAGATAQRYTLVAADQGALVRFEVTPAAQRGTSPGRPVASAPVGPVTPAPNDPPVASAVRITGTPQVGQVLMGSFTYTDAENDPQGVSTFRWLRGGTAIAGATGRTYALVAADQGATVSFEVTPVAQRGTSPGLAVRSAAVGPVTRAPNDPPVASVVRITGTAQVGQLLTGSFTYADAENDPQGVSTFRWLRGGTAIAGATNRTYTLVAADQGATVSFEVTPVAQRGTSPGRPIVSAAVGPVAPPINLPPTASNVLITGTADVGQVLTGSFIYADAENDPQGVSTFRWLRDGTAIAGATARTYTLVGADQGAMASFEVTPVAQRGTSPGLAVTSAGVGPVSPALGALGDANPPVCSFTAGRSGVGTATDDRPSEDTNSNGLLDPGEDLNGNGQIDEDTGIFFVELDPGSTNLALNVDPFEPGAGVVLYTVTVPDPTQAGTGGITATDGADNTCHVPITPILGRDREDGPAFACNGSRCLVPLKCNAVGISCSARVTLFAFIPRARPSDRPAVQAVRRIRFASSVVNIPAGEVRKVRLRLTPRGRRIVRSGTRIRRGGVMEIRSSVGGIQNIPIRIRIRIRARP